MKNSFLSSSFLRRLNHANIFCCFVDNLLLLLSHSVSRSTHTKKKSNELSYHKKIERCFVGRLWRWLGTRLSGALKVARVKWSWTLDYSRETKKRGSSTDDTWGGVRLQKKTVHLKLKRQKLEIFILSSLESSHEDAVSGNFPKIRIFREW